MIRGLMHTKIGKERIQRLQKVGIFSETTALLGLGEIAYFLGWSVSKIKAKLEELQAAGAIIKDTMGTPPKKVWCSCPSLILKFVSRKGQKRECL
jgi:hypothetical protein